MMLKKLRTYLKTEEDLFDPTVRINSVHLDKDNAVLSLSIFDWAEDGECSRWEVRAKGLRDHSFVWVSGELSLYKSDHVLVRQHSDSSQELFFKGIPRSAMETIGRLLVAHRKVTGDWIPFERFINSNCNLEELLNGGYGKIAEGPAFLINTYMDVLTSEGLNPKALTPRSAKWWNGLRWLNTTRPLAVLIIGESFFVAENFEEKQL